MHILILWFLLKNYLIPAFQPGEHISIHQFIGQQIYKSLRFIFHNPTRFSFQILSIYKHLICILFLLFNSIFLYIRYVFLCYCSVRWISLNRIEHLHLNKLKLISLTIKSDWLILLSSRSVIMQLWTINADAFRRKDVQPWRYFPKCCLWWKRWHI